MFHIIPVVYSAIYHWFKATFTHAECEEIKEALIKRIDKHQCSCKSSADCPLDRYILSSNGGCTADELRVELLDINQKIKLFLTTARRS